MGNLQVLCILYQTALVAISLEASASNLQKKVNSLNAPKKQKGNSTARPISYFDNRAWSPEPSHIPAFPLLATKISADDYYARTFPQIDTNPTYDTEAPKEQGPKNSKGSKEIAQPLQKSTKSHGSGKISKSELIIADSKENFSPYNLKAIAGILSSTLALFFMLSILNYFARLSEAN